MAGAEILHEVRLVQIDARSRVDLNSLLISLSIHPNSLLNPAQINHHELTIMRLYLAT